MWTFVSGQKPAWLNWANVNEKVGRKRKGETDTYIRSRGVMQENIIYELDYRLLRKRDTGSVSICHFHHNSYSVCLRIWFFCCAKKQFLHGLTTLFHFSTHFISLFASLFTPFLSFWYELVFAKPFQLLLRNFILAWLLPLWKGEFSPWKRFISIDPLFALFASIFPPVA